MIRYRETHTGSTKVYLDRVYVGTIVKHGTMWHYQPKGRRNPPGDSFPSVSAVKRSLETENA